MLLCNDLMRLNSLQSYLSV